MKELNRIFCYVPAIPVVCWLIIVMSGFIQYHTLPVYDQHPFQITFLLSVLDVLATVLACLSYLFFPLSLLLSLYLFNRQQFKGSDLMALFIALLSVGGFFLFKHYYHGTFMWLMDL